MNTERFTKSNLIKKVRMEAMFNAMDSSAPNSADELLMAASKAERSVTDRRGKTSVSNFAYISKKIPEIESLMDSTDREDREWHTDMWVILKKSIEGHRMFAVEIKSSDSEVNWLKNSEDFKKHHPNTLVLNTRKGTKHGKIISDFYAELDRVANNIRESKKEGNL